MSLIEEINYANDCRTGKPKGIPTVWVEVTENGESWDEEHELPWRWDVCPVCDGKGSHVNPSIDCNGLTSEDFAEDPDFAEEYRRGRYDVPCNECNGRTTVPVVDDKRCTPQELGDWEAECQAEADDHACRMAEMRMGA